jgi:hypothetical protein
VQALPPCTAPLADWPPPATGSIGCVTSSTTGSDHRCSSPARLQVLLADDAVLMAGSWEQTGSGHKAWAVQAWTSTMPEKAAVTCSMVDWRCMQDACVYADQAAARPLFAVPVQALHVVSDKSLISTP